MRVLLLRHGQTRGDLEKVLHAEEPLTELGRRQSTATARWLAGRHLGTARVYSSGQQAARMTADIVARALRTRNTPLVGLEEMRLGRWEGRPYSDLRVHMDELLLGPAGTLGFEGGEDSDQVMRRTRAALAVATAAGGTPVIVSHGFALQALLCSLFDIAFGDAWDSFHYSHANCAVTELDLTDQGVWTAVRIASTAHLPAAR